MFKILVSFEHVYRNNKVICNDEEQSSVEHVYAIGDILDEKLELTPVAIQAGKLLARRLFGGSRVRVGVTSSGKLVNQADISQLRYIALVYIFLC